MIQGALGLDPFAGVLLWRQRPYGRGMSIAFQACQLVGFRAAGLADHVMLGVVAYAWTSGGRLGVEITTGVYCTVTLTGATGPSMFAVNLIALAIIPVLLRAGSRVDIDRDIAETFE